MSRPLRFALAAAAAGAAVLVLVAEFSYSPDQVVGANPLGRNLAGPVGAWIAHALIGSYGLAAFLPPLVLAGVALSLVRDDGSLNLPRRLTAAVLLLPVLAGLAHLLPAARPPGLRILEHWHQTELGGLGGS